MTARRHAIGHSPPLIDAAGPGGRVALAPAGVRLGIVELRGAADLSDSWEIPS